MNFIFILILKVASSALIHPFARSDITVTLSSSDKSLELSFKLACSCQLDVFSIYNNNYSLELSSKEKGGQTHARVKLRSTGLCLSRPLDKDSSAIFIIGST